MFSINESHNNYLVRVPKWQLPCDRMCKIKPIKVVFWFCGITILGIRTSLLGDYGKVVSFKLSDIGEGIREVNVKEW